MATDKKIIQRVLDRMFPLEVSARPMFGEYGLYYAGKFFGFVCDNALFIKVTEPGEVMASRIAKGSPYPGAKPAFKISNAKLADQQWLTALIEATIEALPSVTPRRQR